MTIPKNCRAPCPTARLISCITALFTARLPRWETMVDVAARKKTENSMMMPDCHPRKEDRSQRPRMLSVDLTWKVAASQTDRPRYRAVRGSGVAGLVSLLSRSLQADSVSYDHLWICWRGKKKKDKKHTKHEFSHPRVDLSPDQ